MFRKRTRAAVPNLGFPPARPCSHLLLRAVSHDRNGRESRYGSTAAGACSIITRGRFRWETCSRRWNERPEVSGTQTGRRRPTSKRGNEDEGKSREREETERESAWAREGRRGRRGGDLGRGMQAIGDGTGFSCACFFVERNSGRQRYWFSVLCLGSSFGFYGRGRSGYVNERSNDT